jgi:DedD protein
VERHVKERLVGAAVLMAAAIILIPEMLSGPDRAERAAEPQARASNESAVKTYTIDLNKPPGTNAQAVPETRVPPPEQSSAQSGTTEPIQPPAPATIDAQKHESNPERVARSSPTEVAGESSPAVEGQPSAQQVPPRATSQPRAEVPEETPKPPAQVPRVASEPVVPTSRGWAVQLGSFSSLASAERLAAEVRANHEDVFVMPVKSGATTLYRVRIGPLKDRAAADETLRQVKAKVSGAAIVAHP